MSTNACRSSSAGAASPASTLRRMTFSLIALLGLLGVGMTTLAIVAARVKLDGEEMTPAGIRRNTSTYIKMRDGIEIAVDVWLPADYKAGTRLPVLMRTTRYWRAMQRGWAYRMMALFDQVRLSKGSVNPVEYFNRRGYVLLLVDARGSGASGGGRVGEIAPEEVLDYGEVARWASREPWSNGRIGTFGVSYEGNTAEMAAVPNEPSVKAEAPLFDDFDPVMLWFPNGVYTEGFLDPWSVTAAARDRNDICGMLRVTGLKCWWTRQVTPGVKRVDSDSFGLHLAGLVAQHHNVDAAAEVANVEFRDDPFDTPGTTSLRFADISPYGHRRELETSGAAMQVWCGWLDAGTCEGALERYLTFSNPQQVIIGPCSHGCRYDVDPFLKPDQHAPAIPSVEEQWRMRADFFDRYLKGEITHSIARHIEYFTMGAGSWHSTDVWPPVEFAHARRRYYFSVGHSLSERAPSDATAADFYTVDFAATTGTRTRWHTQNGGGDVVYPDRRDADKRLLTYTSSPLATDVEITGSAVVTLNVASTTSDTAFHVYLEDVGSDGRVTYLNEGMMRAIDRKLAAPDDLPFKTLGPAHALLRADAEPLTPGIPARISFTLWPTSLLIRRGHSIRVAIAGADSPLFRRYPPDGIPVWKVLRNRDQASYIDLPLRER